MRKGVKFRLYPTAEQEAMIIKTFGCCRYIYNRGLDLRIAAYKAGGKAGYKETAAMLTELKRKEETAFLGEPDSMALQQALRDLDRAYDNFFHKRSRFPRFKSKHDHNQSYRTLNQGNGIRIEGNRIRIPKIGFVRFKQSMDVGKIHNATVKRTPTGKYFIVLNVEFEPVRNDKKTGAIGIDVGVKSFYTDSNGNAVPNPRYLEKSSRKLAREQRRLSRKKKGSNNYEKQRIRAARVHEKVTDQRNDFLHKVSTTLVNENQVICVESLDVKGMLRKHRMARSIGSAAWSRFFDMLEYKTQWYGGNVVRVPEAYPSSQLCSVCGYKNPKVKDLSVRKWECPNCGTHHDRDVNAAVNILNKGMEILKAAA